MSENIREEEGLSLRVLQRSKNVNFISILNGLQSSILLTANDNKINLDKRLGLSKISLFSIDFQIFAPSVCNNVTLSQFLKSSIVFLLYKIP